MSNKKNKLKFNRKGGALVMDMYMLQSSNYNSLSKDSKVLMILMQTHWNSFKFVDYGISEACSKIPCAKKTAINAFKELRDKGFIELKEESSFSSRTESKSRSWKLLWMPFGDNAPDNNWDIDKPESPLAASIKRQQAMHQTPPTYA